MFKVLSLLNSMHLELAAGMRERAEDPDMDALVVAHMDFDKKVCASHDLKRHVFN